MTELTEEQKQKNREKSRRHKKKLSMFGDTPGLERVVKKAWLEADDVVRKQLEHLNPEIDFSEVACSSCGSKEMFYSPVVGCTVCADCNAPITIV